MLEPRLRRHKTWRKFPRLRPPLPEFTLFGGMMVTGSTSRIFGTSAAPSDPLSKPRGLLRLCAAAPAAPRGTTLHLGNALAARLYASLLARKVDILFGATVSATNHDGDGVRGVELRATNGGLHSRAAGVVLATGGFSHDATLRQRFFPSSAGAVLPPLRRGRVTACGLRRRRRQHWYAGREPGLSGACVTVSANRRQRGRFPAYRN